MSPEDLALQMSRMKEHFAELDAKLADPQIYAKQFECRVLSAERQRLGTVFRLYDDWAKALRELRENHELLQQTPDETLESEQIFYPYCPADDTGRSLIVLGNKKICWGCQRGLCSVDSFQKIRNKTPLDNPEGCC